MPENDPRNPLAVNVVSVDALAGLDLPNRDDWHALVSTISETKTSLDVLATNMEQSLAAQKKVIQDLSGKPSERASRVDPEGTHAQSGEGGPSLPPEQAARQNVAREAQYDSSYLNDNPFNRMFGFSKRASQVGSVPFGEEGITPTPTGPSFGASSPPPPSGPSGERVLDDPIERLNAAIPDSRQINPLLYGGQFTAQNALYGMSQYLGGRFSTQWNRYQSGQGPQPSSTLFGAAETLGRAGSYYPNVMMAHQYLQRAGNFSQQTQDYGELLGTSAGTSASILGQRIPFTGASFHGLQQGIEDKIKGIFTGGISGSQIGEIRSTLAEQGWTPETPRTSQMQGGLESLFQHDQGVARSVMNSQLMDKAVREGSTSAETFTKSMKSLRDIANQSKISVDELVASMDQFGQANEAAGGTHWVGQETALATAATGFTPTELGGMVQQNPWTQGALFRQTGLPPWQQGTLSPGLQVGGALEGFRQAASMFPSQGQNVQIQGATDAATGKSAVQSIPGSQLQAANLHQFMFPNTPPAVLQKMVENPSMVKNMIKGQNISAAADSLTHQIGKGHPNLLGTGQQGFDQGDLLHMEKTALDPVTGQRLLNADDLKAISDAGGDAGGGRTGGRSGRSSGIASDSSGSDTSPHEVAAARAAKLKEILAQKQSAATDSVQAGGVTIELGAAARKSFHLQDHRSQTKANAGAGIGGAVNSYLDTGASALSAIGY